MCTTRSARTASASSRKSPQSLSSTQLSTSRGFTTSMSFTFSTSSSLTRWRNAARCAGVAIFVRRRRPAHHDDALALERFALGRHHVAAFPDVNARGQQRGTTAGGNERHGGQQQSRKADCIATKPNARTVHRFSFTRRASRAPIELATGPDEWARRIVPLASSGRQARIHASTCSCRSGVACAQSCNKRGHRDGRACRHERTHAVA